jgi:molybdopterin-binding protein
MPPLRVAQTAIDPMAGMVGVRNPDADRKPGIPRQAPAPGIHHSRITIQSLQSTPLTIGETMSIKAINVRNQFRGKVKEIIDGPVVSEVDIETPAGIVTSVITTRSVRDLGLAPGVEVVALVKATEVSIAKL